MPRELILVVDDNQGIRCLLKELLTSQGYRVEVAQNGEDAIKKFHQCAPSVVLLDSKMPGMNGLQVAEKLRSSDPLLPVIILSAYSEEGSIKKAKADGLINNYIAKPFDISEIFKALHSISYNYPLWEFTSPSISISISIST